MKFKVDLRPNDVVGMVFVDANQENHFYYRQEPMPEVGPYEARYQKSVDAGLDFVEAGGLSADQKLSDTEWAAVQEERDTPRHEAIALAEFRGWKNDAGVLASEKQFEKQPLRNHPVSVLRADSKMKWQRMYDAGIAKGNGTEEKRASYRELIAHWDGRDIPLQKEILKLSAFAGLRQLQEVVTVYIW